jgi:hypothetical protein
MTSHTSRNVVLATSVDPVTKARVTELAALFQCPPPRVLRYVLSWGLTHGEEWPISSERPPSPFQAISVRVTPTIRQQVEEAAMAMGLPISRWLRHVVQHITPEDFPASWQPGAAPEASWEDLTRVRPPSHHSPNSARRFMIRVDEEAGQKLDTMMQVFGRAAAEIIRYLITRATPADFPVSWREDQSSQRWKLDRPGTLPAMEASLPVRSEAHHRGSSSPQTGGLQYLRGERTRERIGIYHPDPEEP